MTVSIRDRSVFAALALIAGAACAQPYPSKPLRLIIPYPPGGPTDFVGRAVAQKMSESFGQQVVVDNRAGAAAIIGTELGARAVPDGYTLLFGTGGGLVISPLVVSKVPYHALRDFAPVSMLVVSPQIIVAHPSVPAANLKEFIATAKAKPGFYNFGSVGTGSPNHLGGELLRMMANIDIVHVPYKGTSPAMTDLIAGQVQIMFSSMPSVLPHVQAGRLKVLATGGARRSPAIPNVAAVAEMLPGFEIVTWYGIVVQPKVEKGIIDRLNAEIVRVIALPDVRERFMAQGLEPQSSTPAEFTAYMKSEIDRWTKVVKAAGIKPE